MATPTYIEDNDVLVFEKKSQDKSIPNAKNADIDLFWPLLNPKGVTEVIVHNFDNFLITANGGGNLSELRRPVGKFFRSEDNNGNKVAWCEFHYYGWSWYQVHSGVNFSFAIMQGNRDLDVFDYGIYPAHRYCPRENIDKRTNFFGEALWDLIGNSQIRIGPGRWKGC